MVFGMLSKLLPAEFERNLIRERTKAGLQAARARGRTGGRRKALDDNKKRIAVELYHKREHTVEEICRMMGISKPTLYKYVGMEKEMDQ